MIKGYLIQDRLPHLVFISKRRVVENTLKIVVILSYIAHVVSLLYRLISSARNTDDLSIGLDEDRNTRQRELTKNKYVKGRYHIRIGLEDIFGFAEHHEKATFGLGYKLTLTRASDNSASNKEKAINLGKNKKNSIEWYVLYYTPSILQQAILSKQILSKTELQPVERSAFMKEVYTQNFWTFDLGTQEGINLPIWIIVGCQQRDRQDLQNINNDTFYRPSVTSAQSVIGTKKILIQPFH